MDLKPQSVLKGVAGAYLFLAIVAGAQTPSAPAPTTPTDSTTAAPAAPAAAAAAPAAPTWSVGAVDFSGYVDGYYSYNANRPGQVGYYGLGQVNQLYNFDDETDQFSLEAAKLTLNHDPDPVGAHVDILFGRTNAFLHGSGDATDNYLEQAFISVKPPKAKGFELDFGQFVTSAGQEVIETMNNWSYSHGILFGYAIPYYHFGLRTSMPVTKTWTAGVQVVNGWNNVVDNNGGVTIGLTSSYVKPKFTLNTNYYTGPENYNTQKGYRNLFDTTLLLTPTTKFNAYINYDYGQNHLPSYSYTTGTVTTNVKAISQHWQGVAVSGRGQITPNAALVARYEYFYDQGAANATGTKQHLDEFTATYEYKWPVGLLMRAEYRRDWSDVHFFQKGDNEAVGAQSTATVGLIAFFGPKR
jgi:hypothetical protein